MNGPLPSNVSSAGNIAIDAFIEPEEEVTLDPLNETQAQHSSKALKTGKMQVSVCVDNERPVATQPVSFR